MAIIVYVKGIDKTSYLSKNSLRIVKGLGSKNSLSLTFNCNDWMPKVGQDITVYDGTTLLFGGVIRALNCAKIEPLKDITAYIEVVVSSDGYQSIFARRTINCFYENQTAGYIFENIIDMVINDPNYNDDVTKGDITAGNTFEKYSAICKSVKEIYDDVAAQSGLQWYIDDSKSINLISEFTVSTGSHTIDTSGSFTNYQITGYSIEMDNYCNKVFIKGGDDGIYTTVQDTAEITLRLSAEGTAYSSGIYGKVIEARDIRSLTALTTIGDNELKKYGYEPIELQIRSFTSTWTCGEKIQVCLAEFGMTENKDFIIDELVISRYDTDILAYDMTLTRRKSADFSSQKLDKGKEFFEKLIRQNKGGISIETGSTGQVKNYQATITATATITA